MTTQDALNDLKRTIYELTSPMYLERFKDQFDTLQALIDKQIPKTVYLVGEHQLYNCPTCERGVKAVENYCWHCGQKLFFEKTYTMAEVAHLWDEDTLKELLFLSGYSDPFETLKDDNFESVYDKSTGRSCARYDLAEEDDD